MPTICTAPAEWVQAKDLEANGTTAVVAFPIPANTYVHAVIVRVSKVAVGASNAQVGDEDDADGYILAFDAVATAVGTIVGDDKAEAGVYQTVALGAAPNDHTHWSRGKLYTAEKNLQLSLSAAPTTQPKYDIMMLRSKLDQD